MPSKTSWFNKELVLQIARSTGWISIVYFLGLFFTLPLRMIMMYSDENRIDYVINNLFYYDFPIQAGLMMAVPVLLSVFLFRYLHVKQATDLMHSLPMTRVKMFQHYTLTGLVFLVVPVTMISAIVLLLHTTMDLNRFFGAEDVFYWAGITILFNLLFYSAGVFVAMLTGISAVHAVLTYIMLLFPAGIIVILFFNIKIFLYGFPFEYYLNRQIEKMSPLTYAALLDETQLFQWKTVLTYIIFTILFYSLALFFYKKRNLEAASEAIAFPKLRLIFKYGVTFCMTLLSGMYFNELSYRGLGWTLFGYVLGAVIGYYLAEMVLKKTWRVFNHVKGLAIYSAVITVLVLLVQFLGIYENKIPDPFEINNVILTDSPYQYLYREGINDEYYVPAPLKEKDNIENVRKLHEQIIADKKINEDKTSIKYYGSFFFLYELENGRKVIRQYQIDMRRYQDLYKPIFESEEYKRMSNAIFKVDEKKIKNIEIRAHGPVNKVVTLSDSKEIAEAISVLREDVLAETYEDSLYYQSRSSMIEMSLNGHQFVSLEFKPTYTKFAEWLKEKELLNDAKITGEDISHVLVGKGDFKDLDPDPAKVKEILEQSGNMLEITNKEQMGIALDKASVNSRHEYAAIFYYNSKEYYEVLYFDENHLPEFIKEHFK